MTATDLLNPVLWGVQGFLALFFLGAGVPKLLGRGLERWTGFDAVPRGQASFTGAAELLGAAGLVLPMVTGVLPWLTPLAAAGLGVIVLMAAGFHLRAGEHLEAIETMLWAGILAAVAAGRWELLASRFAPSPVLLVATLGVLVPSAIANVIILARRPVVRPAAPPQLEPTRYGLEAAGPASAES